MKSLIYNGTHSQVSIDILKGILASSPALEDVCIISSVAAKPEEIDFKQIRHQEFDYFKVHDAIYPEITALQQGLMLDGPRLDQMSSYWFVALKMMDRLSPEIALNYHTRMELLLNHIRFWDAYLTEYKVDCYMGMNYPHEVFDYVIYALCKSKGIRTLFFDTPQVPGYVQLIDSVEENNPQIKKLIEAQPAPANIRLEPRLEEYYQRQTTNYQTPKYMQKNLASLKRETSTVQLIQRFFTRSWSRIKRAVTLRHLNYDRVIKILYFNTLFGSRAERKLKQAYQALVSIPDFSKPYIFVPLHFQPECTTSPQGGYFVFQELLIEMLERTLPEGHLIYVKEHPIQRLHGRSAGFYQKIAAFKKVRLVPLETSAQDLIKSSLAVATVTGTAGWEGLFKNKPVFLFGSVFFQYAPGVYTIRSESDCRLALKEILSRTTPFDFSRELRYFLSKVPEFMIRGWIDSSYEDVAGITYPENLKNLVTAVQNRLR